MIATDEKIIFMMSKSYLSTYSSITKSCVDSIIQWFGQSIYVYNRVLYNEWCKAKKISELAKPTKKESFL